MRLLNRRPRHFYAALLTLLPFILVIACYAFVSEQRLEKNPHDRLLPSAAMLFESTYTMAFTSDKIEGMPILWKDSKASLQRLVLGLALSAIFGLVIGIGIGIIPYLQSIFSLFVAFVALIPPLAVLPILFIAFGLGEMAKVMLLIIGVTPFMIRAISNRVMALPQEEIIKAQSLGANTWQIIFRVVLPQIIPALLENLRLALGSAWLFLISAEAIAASSGLGFRIFLMRRYLAMDIILPYVIWITLLALLMDLLLRLLSKLLFPWLVRTL